MSSLFLEAFLGTFGFLKPTVCIAQLSFCHLILKLVFGCLKECCKILREEDTPVDIRNLIK